MSKEITKKKLIASSMGICGNPMCQINLFNENGYIGEIAHIHAKSENGPRGKEKNRPDDIDNYNNLMILCPNCHTLVDKKENTVDKKKNIYTVKLLKGWKEEQENRINNLNKKEFDSFEEMKDWVLPLLKENKEVFDDYGLNNEWEKLPDKYKLWKKEEAKILINNEKLKAVFKSNENLFSKNNKDILPTFYSHVREFENTRDETIKRDFLFPKKLNSIFGLEEVLDNSPSSNYFAFKTFFKKLKDENRSPSFTIVPEPILTYKENNDKFKSLNLKNTHEVDQLYWSNGCYFKKNNGMSFKSIIYIAQKLEEAEKKYTFEPIETIIKYDNKVVKLVYVYTFSISDLQEIKDKHKLTTIVNLYNWNGSDCLSQDAIINAKLYNIELIRSDQFVAKLFSKK